MFIRLTREKINVGIAVVIIALSGYACGSDMQVSEQPTEKRVLNIGHAGMGFTSLINPFNPLPDNSMRSINKALLLGADGVEVDVQMSKDSVLILYHDKYLDSKTNKEGCIGELPAAEVLDSPYRVGFLFDLFHDEKVISLDSLLSIFSKKDTFPWLYLDIHSYNYCDTTDHYKDIAPFARAMAMLVKKYNVPHEKIIPTSTYVPMLLELRKADPEFKLMYEEDVAYHRSRSVMRRHHFNGIVIKHALVPAIEELQEARDEGMEIVIFGGKAKSTLREMLNAQPDVLQVNNVKALKELLDEAGSK